ncbi:hypothetical protein AAG570_009590, partial [Ranatra chinensis]
QLKVSSEVAKFTKEKWQETIKFDWAKFKDAELKRQFKKYAILGTAALPEEKHQRLEKIVSQMEEIYSKAKICDFNNTNKCDLSLEPELTQILASSRNPEELEHVWVAWRDATGKKCKDLFQDYVVLSNEASVLNNFTDTSEYWLYDFEDPNFQQDIEDLWHQMEPLYRQLHAYVRNKLREKYGDDVVTKKGPIPAHLLGNMWSQTWSNIFDITAPYPNVKSTDVTTEMVNQGYTPLKMFKLSEEFFTSLNLSAMPDAFWKRSIIEKPKDRDIVCHASAWDFYDGKDFRIKECTQVQQKDLRVVHHEMGHIQYYLQYKNQPHVFKEGANSGFHEAVGDVIALSVSTPNHLKKIGLLDEVEENKEAVINQLFYTALDKVAFLPFGYLMDLWRWDVFRGKIKPEHYNCNWWKLRHKYQGIQPPVDRSEENFDPAAKYHIIADVPYIRYFVSFVIQFQFHKALCEKAGEFDPNNPNHKPLHQCDIYQNKEAGNLLGTMLQMGSSKPWPDAMEVITGQRKMDAGPLLQYFRPLMEWLEAENARTGEYIGWEKPTKSKFDEVISTGIY